MAHYEELDDILNQVIGNYFLTNQNLCKLLFYYPEEKSFTYNPLSQLDIPNTSDLLMKNIFPMPKMPDADLDQNCFLTVTLTGGEPLNNNKYREVYLVVDIICHLDTWIVKNGFRPYKIANEIDSMLNNKLTILPIINKPQSLPFKARDYANRYYGLQLYYVMQINSNIECGV